MISMKKDKREKNRIDLDLTSMLDVIFIILIVVMCQLSINASNKDRESESKQNTIDAMQTENVDLHTEIESLKEENVLYETHLSNMENEEHLVSFITLSAEYETADPSIRHIRLLSGEDTKIEDMIIEEETKSDKFKELEIILSELIETDTDVPVLLTLYEDRILYRDQTRIMQILDDLREDNSNLFVRHAGEKP